MFSHFASASGILIYHHRAVTFHSLKIQPFETPSLLTITAKNIIIKAIKGSSILINGDIKMKKIVSLFITVIMLATVLAAALPVEAADYTGSIELSMSNAAGLQNDEITVDLNIDKNTGFFAFIIYIYYDSDSFILKDVTYNDQINDTCDIEEIKEGPAERMKGAAWDVIIDQDIFAKHNIGINNKEFKCIYLEWSNLESNCEFTGTVAQLKFQIMGIAEDGDYEIGIMPSPGNAIDKDMGDLEISWKNARVHVGDDKVPKDTTPVKTIEDTVSPEEMTEEAETKSREQMESEAYDDTTDKTETPETIKGDDGNIYIVNENGETELYEPDKEAVDSDTKDAVSADTDKAPADTESEPAETDVAGDATPDEKNTVNLFGMKIPLIYFIAAVLLILIAIAAVLFIIISKTKKSDKELDEQ